MAEFFIPIGTDEKFGDLYLTENLGFPADSVRREVFFNRVKIANTSACAFISGISLSRLSNPVQDGRALQKMPAAKSPV